MPNTDPTFTDRRDDSTDVLRVVEYMGFEFSIYEKPNTSRLWFRGSVDGNRPRKSTGHSDLQAATEFVVATIEDLAQRIITGADLRQGTLTLQQVWSLFEREKLPSYDRRQLRNGFRHSLGRILDIWGRDKVVADIDAHDVEAYVEERSERDDVKKSTAKRDLTLLHVVLRWANEKKVDGTPVIEDNPMEWSWVPDVEDHARRPVTGHDRFLKLLPYTRTVPAPEHRGYCTTMWVLARYTGRRIGAIRRLRYCDLLLSPEAIRRKIEELRRQDIIRDDVPDAYLEKAADVWKHGAVRWPPHFNKKGVETWVVPLHPTARRALEAHLKRHPGAGEDFLFESHNHRRSDGLPISAAGVDKWFDRIEDTARAHGVDLRDRERDGWHALRRGWKTEIPDWFEDKVVAKVGGWTWRGESSLRDTGPFGASRTMKRYQRTLPVKEFRVATALPAPRVDADTDSVTAETIEEMDPQELKGMLREILL